MLRLPGPEDEVPPLVAPAAAMAEPAEEEEYDEMEADEAMAAARSDRTFIAILALAAICLVGVVAWWLMPEKKGPAPLADLPAPAVSPRAGDASPAKGGGTVDPPKPLLIEIESAVKAFLEAPTREDALALVADPDGSARKWDAWFAGKTYAAPGFQGLVGDPVTTGVGEGAASVALVRTGDYRLREISLVKRDGHLKVDWDSWVGWSEMTWEEFRAKKPAKPVLFRVQLSLVDYFNFDFRDDNQWSSYRLDPQDGITSLYGYVPRTGDLDKRLRPADTGVKNRWVLKLKFPPDATRDNQVLIDSIVAEGWLVKPEE